MCRKKNIQFITGFVIVAALCLITEKTVYIQKTAVNCGTKIEGAKKDKEVKKVYLTFDDGPSMLTSQYLDILKKENVKATFFLIGQQIEGELIPVVKREIKEGHEIGLHTFSHEADQIYSTEEKYYDDLQKVKKCIQKKVKIVPRLFRFPWGSANAYVKPYKSSLTARMKKEGFDFVDWNVSGEDSVGCPSIDSILWNVRKDYSKVKDPVILLHDSSSCKATLHALPQIIKELKEEGYQFETISNRKNSCHFGEY